MSIAYSPDIVRRLERIETLLNREPPKAYYTVDEFARRVNRAPFTVRQWANLGRIHAERSMTRSGRSRRYAISHQEYLRFQREGLLPRSRGAS